MYTLTAVRTCDNNDLAGKPDREGGIVNNCITWERDPNADCEWRCSQCRFIGDDHGSPDDYQPNWRRDNCVSMLL